MALFSDADHVIQVDAHMADVTAFISGSNIALQRDCSELRGPDDIQWGTDKYVVLTLLRLQEGCSIMLPGPGRSPADFIRGPHSDLQHAQCTPEGDGGLPSERQWPIWSFDALTDRMFFTLSLSTSTNSRYYADFILFLDVDLCTFVLIVL